MSITDTDNLVVNGRLNLTPEMAARLGVPNGTELWRYNLVRGMLDPDGYSNALRIMNNAALHLLLTMFDQIEVVARRNPGIIVPVQYDDELHVILDDLRARVRAEASYRGVTLVPWTETRN
jgi:hypothetical protein